MFIAKIEGEKITVSDYRELFPSTSFPPSGPSAEFMAENGCMGVTVFKPHDRRTEKLVPATPYVEGDTVYTVDVEPLTQEEIDAATASQAAQVRAARDRILAQSDWRVIKALESNIPQDFEWAAYRQALRDISKQAGFPWDVQWPTDPDYVPPVTN